MPTSLSVWVTKNGDDSNPDGPFLTLGAARTYLKNNFTLTSQQHGLIQIGPGVWDESIAVSAADGDRFIDYQGSGIDVTAIRRSNSNFIYVIVATAENHFSDMTIEYNGSTNSQCAIDVDDGMVEFNHCKILSTKQCICRMRGKSVVSDCTIESTATNSELVIYVMDGTLQDCTVTCKTLGAAGYLVNTLGSTGVMLNCRLDSVSTLVTPPEARCMNDVRGVVKDCRLEAQGLTVNMFQGGAYIENSYFSTEGTGNMRVVEHIKASMITGCVFHQRKGPQGCVSRITDTNVKVFHSTFYAPTSNVNLVNSVENDNSEWYDCAFINTGNSGFSLDANAAGRTIRLGNIASNRPLDPDLTVLNVISDYGALNVTDVKTGNYTARVNELVRCNPAGGAFTVTLPAVFSSNKGMTIVVKNQSASTNVITIARSGANTIDGAASVTINTARGFKRLVSDGGAEWVVL